MFDFTPCVHARLWCAARRVVAAVVVSATLWAEPSTARGQDSAASEEGFFLDLGGEWVPLTPVYQSWFGARRRAPDYARAAAWSVTLLAFGTTWYWARADLNRSDWDFPDMGERLSFEAVRFDDNHFTTNNLLHPMAGSGYYGLSRINGLSPVEAFILSYATSTFWEYAMEWREKVSINDMVFTPGAGLPLGELFHQLSEYFSSAPGGGAWPNRLAAVTLGFPRWLHDQLDDPAPPPPLPPDSLGFSSAYWHRFRIGWELAELSNDVDHTGVATGPVLEAELVAMPGYLRPGSISTGFTNANFTRGHLRLLFDEAGFDEVDLSVSTMVAGWLWQELDLDDDGGLHGYSGAAGLDVSYRYQTRWLLDRKDELAVVHVAGPAADLRFPVWNGWLRLRASTHVDFAGVRSLAFDTWSGPNGDDGVKGLLAKRGYYYGLGFSGDLEAAVEWDALALEASGFFGGWDSVEGLDRHQELVTRDVSTEDQVLDYRLSLVFGPPDTALRLRLGWEEIIRWSQMDGVSDVRWDRRWTAGAGAEF